MSACYYIVAGQHFIVFDFDAVAGERMRRRYEPFAVPVDRAMAGSVLFDLAIVPPFIPLSGTEKVARWRHDSLECLYERTETEVSISWLQPETAVVLAQLHCDRDFRHAKAWLSGEDDLRERCIDYFLMLLFALAAVPTQTLLFHASAVACGGTACLFLGKSGTGKSTHSRLWLQHIEGAELVNDDCPAVGLRDGRAVVFGTPWSGKTPCYRNVSFPVGAFVRLRQEKCNRMERAGIVQALAILLAASSDVAWEAEYRRMRQDMVASVVSAIPVYRLDCLPEVAAARLCHETVISQSFSGEKL